MSADTLNEFWRDIAEQYLAREPEATVVHVRELGAALQKTCEQYMAGELPPLFSAVSEVSSDQR